MKCVAQLTILETVSDWKRQTTEIMSMLKEDYIKRMTPLLSLIHYQMYFQGILKISTSRRTLWDSSQRHS